MGLCRDPGSRGLRARPPTGSRTRRAQEYFSLYGAPTGLFLAGLAALSATGRAGGVGVAGLASGVLCIAAVAGLGKQKTARLGETRA